MSYRRQGTSWDTQAATTATGCVLGLVLAAVFGIFQLSRYRPSPYSPLSPDKTIEQRTRQIQGGRRAFWGCLVLVAFLVFVYYPNAPTDKNRSDSLTIIVPAVIAAFFFGFLGYILPATQPPPRQYETPSSARAKRYRLYPTKTAPDYVSGSHLVETMLSAQAELLLQIVATPQGTYWQVTDVRGSVSPQVLTDHLKSHAAADVVPDKVSRSHREFLEIIEKKAPQHRGSRAKWPPLLWPV